MKARRCSSHCSARIPSGRGAILVLLALCLLPARVEAVTVYNLDDVFRPSSHAGAVPSMGTVTVTDLGEKVRFEVVNTAGPGSRLVSLFFNFSHGSAHPNQLEFSNVSAEPGTYQTILAPRVNARIPKLKADGDGYFDGQFKYRGHHYLGHGQALSFDLGVPGENLEERDFHVLSLPGGRKGPYILASHFKHLEADDSSSNREHDMEQPPAASHFTHREADYSSAWVGTKVAAEPLPGAALLFGSGLARLVASRVRKRAA